MKWLALIGICLIAFTAFLDFANVSTALPFIQKAFQINISQLQWLANIFAIVLSMTMIAAGKFGDRWGRKKVFYIGSTIFAVTCLAAGFCKTIEWLIFFRALQGLGVSVIFVVAISLISEVFHGPDKVRAIGIFGAITGAGLTIGPFLGGMIIGLLDWRWIFWINIPFLVTGLAICLLTIKDLHEHLERPKIDWKGLIFLIVGLGSFTYGIVEMSPWIALIGAISLALLIYFDIKAPAPLLALSIFKKKLLLLAVLSVVMAGIISYVFMFINPLFLRNELNLSPYAIGLMIAIIPVGQVLISSFFSTLHRKQGLANLFLISCSAAVLAATLHLFFTPHIPLYCLVIPFALLGIN